MSRKKRATEEEKAVCFEEPRILEPNDLQEVEPTNFEESLLVEEISLEILASDPVRTQELIWLYLNRLLKEWEDDLMKNQRESDDRLYSIAFNQSKEYLKPFFKKLKTKVTA